MRTVRWRVLKKSNKAVTYLQLQGDSKACGWPVRPLHDVDETVPGLRAFRPDQPLRLLVPLRVRARPLRTRKNRSTTIPRTTGTPNRLNPTHRTTSQPQHAPEPSLHHRVPIDSAHVHRVEVEEPRDGELHESQEEEEEDHVEEGEEGEGSGGGGVGGAAFAGGDGDGDGEEVSERAEEVCLEDAVDVGLL